MRMGLKILVAVGLAGVTVGAFSGGTAAYRAVQRNERAQALVMYSSAMRIAARSPLSLAAPNLAKKTDLRPVELFSKVEHQLRAYYVEKIDDNALLAFGTADSMVDSLTDPYSRFLEPEQLDAYRQRARGVYAGIGATLASRRIPIQAQGEKSEDSEEDPFPIEKEDEAAMPKYDDPVDLNVVERDGNNLARARFEVFIAAVIPGGPAETAGLRAGDTIRKVNGKLVFTRNLDSLDEMLLLPTQGSVKLSLARKGDKKPVEATVPFGVTRFEPVASRVSDGVGVITVRTLGPGTGEAVVRKVKEMRAARVPGIVLDLRHNAEGELAEAVTVAGAFAPGGTLVKVKERAGKWRDVPAPADAGATPMPRVAALVDESTSGPAELVAAVLKARHSGQVIGAATPGRAGCQEVFDTPGGSALLLTTGLFSVPHGDGLLEVEGKGVTPDIAVKAGDGQDVAMQRAVRWVKGGAA